MLRRHRGRLGAHAERDGDGGDVKVENRKGDLAVISSFEYTRDALGNPLRVVREDGYATYYPTRG